MKRIFIVAIVALAFSWSFGDRAVARLTDPSGGTGGGPIAGSLNVKVVYDGTINPVEGAFVMAGSAPGCPFPDNWGLTSAAGEIAFSHSGLKGPITVTAGLAGYQYFTLVNVDANDLVIPLKPVSTSTTTYEVGDKVSGIDVDNGLFNVGDGNVDMAFVVNSMTLEELMSFNIEGLLGPMEIMEILGNQFEVPSNLYVPQQYELFIEIKKDHYYLYLPAGNHTLIAMSGRIPLQDILDAGDIVDLIPKLDWREIDTIDITVTGNKYDADLTVDPNLVDTVTVNLGNLPEDCLVYCLSIGDLDDLHGLGRLAPLGMNVMENPVGGSGSGTLTMSTTAATGKFAGMGYFPVAAVQMNQTDDILVITERTSHSQTYTSNLNTYFKTLDLGYGHGKFSWNDVENPSSGSPDVDVQFTLLANPNNSDIYWQFMISGDLQQFAVPRLPAQAPPGLASGTSYQWTHFAFGLTYDLPSFDFNSFAFSDIPAHGSHMAIDMMEIQWRKRVLAPRCPVFDK
ncbi:MAG: hypothetical protein ACYTG7_16050 [Planctomycetota bacterium]